MPDAILKVALIHLSNRKRQQQKISAQETFLEKIINPLDGLFQKAYLSSIYLKNI